jgi:hypothetical protein
MNCSRASLFRQVSRVPSERLSAFGIGKITQDKQRRVCSEWEKRACCFSLQHEVVSNRS